MRKDVQHYLRSLRRSGWTVSKTATGRGHIRIVSPTGQVLTAPSTPSCYRGLRNLKADVRRHTTIPTITP